MTTSKNNPECPNHESIMLFVKEMKTTMNKDNEDIWKAIDKIRTTIEDIKTELNDFKMKVVETYANRLPTWGTVVISVLTGMLGILGGFLISKF